MSLQEALNHIKKDQQLTFIIEFGKIMKKFDHNPMQDAIINQILLQLRHKYDPDHTKSRAIINPLHHSFAWNQMLFFVHEIIVDQELGLLKISS